MTKKITQEEFNKIIERKVKHFLLKNKFKKTSTLEIVDFKAFLESFNKNKSTNNDFSCYMAQIEQLATLCKVACTMNKRSFGKKQELSFEPNLYSHICTNVLKKEIGNISNFGVMDILDGDIPDKQSVNDLYDCFKNSLTKIDLNKINQLEK